MCLALGCRLGPFGTLPQYDMEYWPKGAKIIQVDIDHRQLGLTRRVDLPVAADAREFARQLLASCGTRPAPGPRTRETGQGEKGKRSLEEELRGWSTAPSHIMHPRRFLQELSAAVPPGAIVTTDVGNTCSMCNSYFGFQGPGSS